MHYISNLLYAFLPVGLIVLRLITVKNPQNCMTG